MDFICRMKDYVPRSDFITRTVETVKSQFAIRSTDLDEVNSPLSFAHSSKLLTTQELEEAALEYHFHENLHDHLNVAE